MRIEPFFIFVEFDSENRIIRLTTYDKELVRKVRTRQIEGWKTIWEGAPKGKEDGTQGVGSN